MPMPFRRKFQSIITLIVLIFLYYNSCEKVLYTWENNSNISDILDHSSLCEGNEILNLFVPFGVGKADSLVLLFLDVIGKSPACILNSTVDNRKEIYQIIVIEFLDETLGMEEIAKECKQKGIGYLTIQDMDPPRPLIPVCDYLERSEIGYVHYVHVSDADEVLLKIADSRYFHSIKVTITTARLGAKNSTRNCVPSEVPCYLKRHILCVNMEVACDKNINCGKYYENDEDYRYCKERHADYIWVIVMLALFTVALVYLTVVYLMRTYMLSMSDNFFIFNEDEDNRLIIKSQMNSHVWQQTRKIIIDPPCFCQASESNNSVTED